MKRENAFWTLDSKCGETEKDKMERTEKSMKYKALLEDR